MVKTANGSPQPLHRSKWRLYYELTRLHKFPAGSILVFWPCAWGLTMAAYRSAMPPVELTVKLIGYLVGSTLLHNAACIINDICDIDFDRRVERTKSRPLASGALSVYEAAALLVGHLVICLWMLSWTKGAAPLWGIIGVFPLHGLYPLMKRWTNWPQAWLGLAMNWGFTVAWTSELGRLPLYIFLPFVVGCVRWTILYDTIYACQDKKDDSTAGVKSTALLFGSGIRPILSCFAAIFISCLLCLGILNEQRLPFFAVSVIGAAAHLLWQLTTTNFDIPSDCWSTFTANNDTGLIVWAGILVDYLLSRDTR
ncbi:UbiA prenyltransferase [Heliocybe sulcata]|uniref:4-hydroxybenzoate polyprenyltransferase, mitochondrial n=1 Tax=Heliocybe sulcata TaxID=5364 RepID=A0A5C3MLY4_9AGAM|nr:UbiA prenyltransferase [Heliocybe sulcata]